MKWLLAGLLVSNIALYLWANNASNQIGDSEFTPKSSVDAKGMRLVSEIPDSDNLDCYRIGPFHEPTSIDQATTILKGFDADFSLRSLNARKLRAYRVYLGPISSSDAVESVQQKLKTAGVAEYPIALQDGNTIISLGLFSQRDTADRFIESQRKLIAALEIGASSSTNKDNQVGVRPELRTLKPQSWIIVNPRGNRVLGESLAAIQWSEPGVNLASTVCGEN